MGCNRRRDSPRPHRRPGPSAFEGNLSRPYGETGGGLTEARNIQPAAPQMRGFFFGSDSSGRRPWEHGEKRRDQERPGTGSRARDAARDRPDPRRPREAARRGRPPVDGPRPVQRLASRPRRGGQGRHPRGGGNAVRVRHDRDLGRHLDGHGRHARLARLARGHRGLDRARRLRPRARRRRRPLRLRQDDPRRRDGARAAGPAVRRPLRRLDRARAASRARTSRSRTSSRRSAPTRPGRSRTRSSATSRRARAPARAPAAGQFTANTMATALTFLGLSPMGANDVPATDPAKAGVARAVGRLVMEPAEGRPDAVEDPHARRVRERDRGRRRDRRLDERRPPPPRDRARGRRAARPRRLRRDLGADAPLRRPQAGRPLHGARPRARRRLAPRRAAPRGGGPPEERDDGLRPDALRRGARRRRDAGPGGRPRRRRRRSSRTAGSRSCAARSRPRARS